MNAVYSRPSLDGHYPFGMMQQQPYPQQQLQQPYQQSRFYQPPPQHYVQHAMAAPAHLPLPTPASYTQVPSHVPQAEWRPLPHGSVSANYAAPSTAFYAPPQNYPYPPSAQPLAVPAHSRHAFAAPSPASMAHYAAHEAWTRQANGVAYDVRDPRSRWSSHDSNQSRSSSVSSGSWVVPSAHPAAAAHDRWTEQSLQHHALTACNTAAATAVNELMATDAEVPQQQPTVVRNTDEQAPVEYDLIAPMAAVPPPPPVERSAVPLADLATELTWEACLRGVNGPSGRQRSLSSRSRSSRPFLNDLRDEIAHPVNRGSSRSSPHTPELFFGAIGDGRVARKVSSMSLDDGFLSDESSPGSSAPGTPDNVRLAGLGLGYGLVGEQHHVKQSALSDEYALDDPVEVIRTNARRLSSKPAHPAFPSEPSPAFRQFVKQVLTATLIAPEDIALALHYVSRISSSSVIPPAKAEDGVNGRANALKAAPFKIFLGALMLANKTLQDNSYRNETFAAVSGIPLKDVTELEIYVFSSLGFDVSIGDVTWRVWLDDLLRRAQSGRGDVGNACDVDQAIRRLQRATARPSDTSSNPSSPIVGVPMSPDSPQIARELPRFLPPLSTPLLQSRNAALLDLDMDASGPRRPAAPRSAWADLIIDSPVMAAKNAFTSSRSAHLHQQLFNDHQLC